MKIDKVIINSDTIHKLTAPELKVYAALAVFGGKHTFAMTLDQISARCGMSKSTVRRAIDTLERRGYLTRRSCFDKQKQQRTCNRYRIKQQIGGSFIIVPYALIKTLSPRELLVVCCIYEHIGRTGLAYPSERQIAFEARMSRTTVRDILKGLEERGELLRYARKYRKTSARRSFVYRFCFDSSADPLCIESDDNDIFYVEQTVNAVSSARTVTPIKQKIHKIRVKRPLKRRRRGRIRKYCRRPRGAPVFLFDYKTNVLHKLTSEMM